MQRSKQSAANVAAKVLQRCCKWCTKGAIVCGKRCCKGATNGAPEVPYFAAKGVAKVLQMVHQRCHMLRQRCCKGAINGAPEVPHFAAKVLHRLRQRCCTGVTNGHQRCHINNIILVRGILCFVYDGRSK